MEYTDQIGHSFKLSQTPKRIVSLVPSQTEFLFDIGLAHEIVGITKYCIYPKDKVDNYVKIGGTKNISLSKIKALEPDLIIANKEENTKEIISSLQALYPVYTSDISNLEDALQMMEDIGNLTQKQKETSKIVLEINQNFAKLGGQENKWKSIYLIWRKPWMSVGSDTFIHHLMMLGGFYNCFSDKSRYPILTEEEIIHANPQFIFLSSEPYPFKERHVKELELLCPHSKIILVDGEMFSWYGSRLKHSADHMKQIRQNCQE